MSELPSLGGTLEVDADPMAFARIAAERGWGDGLPLIPPEPKTVADYVNAAGLPGEHVVARIPPQWGDCTVARLAANAVMAGAPKSAMPLLVASVQAVTEPDFGLQPMNATTAPVIPALVVNGAARDAIGIAYGAGCVGGADGVNAAVGRALRLVMRNVGGQRIGLNSQSVFGQPGRVTGIVIGEWEELSPWEPLATRRGATGDAVTVFSTNGTMNIVDNVSETADLLLDRIGRSLAYPGSNGYRPHNEYFTVMVGLNPIWAQVIGESYPDIEDVQARLWDIASLPLTSWPAEHQADLLEAEMVAGDGRVHLAESPDRVLVVVCGGRGGHHALALHGFSSCVPVTKAVGEGATAVEAPARAARGG